MPRHNINAPGIPRMALDEEDLVEIGRIQGNSRDLCRLIGDCGYEYRR